MAKEILYLDGVTGLGTYEGDGWSYGPRFEVPAGNEDGNREHVFKNEGRFFSDALGGRYNGYWGAQSYIMPKDVSAGLYPWMQAGWWQKMGDPSIASCPFIFIRYYFGSNRWNAYTGGFADYNDLTFDGNSSGVVHTREHNKWFWTEVRVYSHTSNGIAEMRVNESLIKRWTGIRTVTAYRPTTGDPLPPTGEIKLNSVMFSYQNFQSYSYDVKFDDMYVMFADTEGELDWISRSVCEPLYVNGDGAEIMATPIGPTSHASVEFPVNDIIYVAATAGERDCYSFSNLESDRTRTVHGVKVTARAKRSYPSTATIRCYCRVNGSNYYGDTHYLSPEWREYIHIWVQNPDTSTAWTREDLDAAQFGFERVA